tara:strand:+ start:17340 stop:17522 length:183 start_codon:yes stop_codon:yes gene_type:complete
MGHYPALYILIFLLESHLNPMTILMKILRISYKIILSLLKAGSDLILEILLGLVLSPSPI